MEFTPNVSFLPSVSLNPNLCPVVGDRVVFRGFGGSFCLGGVFFVFFVWFWGIFLMKYLIAYQMCGEMWLCKVCAWVVVFFFFFSVGINIVLYPISSFPAMFLQSLLLEVLYSLNFSQYSDAFLWLHRKDSTHLVIVHESYSWVHSFFFKF